MSYVASAHPTKAGLPATETSPSQSSEEHSDYHPAALGSGPAPSPLHPSKAKRRSSKAKVATEIRRSSSTPHMRNIALGNSGELSPTADKRRNKLGYHRTSVACGHCRRRKIRCLLAPDDPQNRCANCIRLKKECNFYPVEQNPENQRAQPGAPKDTSSGAPGSSTSSPRHPSLVPSEKVEEFRPPFPSAAAAGVPASRYGMQSDSEIDPHHVPMPNGLPMQQPNYPYPHAIDTQWPSTGFLPSSSLADSPSSSTGYWRPSPSTANSAYGSESNVSGGHTPAAMSASSTMSFGPPDSSAWGQPGLQPPTRSMSYGNIESVPSQYPGAGLGIHPQDMSRRTSPYPFPTSIDTNPAAVQSTSLGGNSSAPLSAPIVPNQPYAYPPNWCPYRPVPSQHHDMPMSGRSMSAQWYSAEPGQLDQVQEEGGAPMTFSHPGMQPFYSGT